ncbi:LptA/OstA family protein [Polynucleobacter paneuropaeus]|uniref:Organic solvent tolerance protein OstA n=2 Tax=Polynucleobacter paneuropaeus TaxID=2527775 RepID=A0A2Z4JU58_9BURK|nr:LptA/OstA family protein [Polynucleobacter paneuropaeus]AWW48583.1 organic solvent tolerance protein OstA [Polynucleobacter paneuropaeus]AWW50418.1 organic solvent tolerance protein OstA [Polynucleobacter paneuropaeus]MBT8516823.1 organic solvent tolerance protein OstA [Polynucleobacter paneuropaeus]MBT8517618.1 organic solvent tolerance protein OstA [Polynucleobacter paneuropaeus]MBT8520490.1 organic solvent tolerance protein OstA [Polynucleobacter paneuropaeus]
MHLLIPSSRFLSLISLMMVVMGAAYAEKADQKKPLILEADKVSVNDVQQAYELQGNILLIKGSILVTGEQGNIKVDPEGYEFVTMESDQDTTASFRQRREGPANEFIQANGKNVVYDAKTEVLTITGDASMKRLLNMQMLDQLNGWKIEYDDVKQYYRVFPPPDAKESDLPLARAMLSPRQKATLEK